MKETWTWNDGWILMSLYMAGNDESTELYKVLGAADASNHAIPTIRELSSAFTKLKQHGVINFEENKYKIESTYITEIEKAYNSKGGLFESGNKGKKWLEKCKLSTVNNSVIEVTEDQLSIAYNDYTKQIRK